MAQTYGPDEVHNESTFDCAFFHELIFRKGVPPPSGPKRLRWRFLWRWQNTLPEVFCGFQGD